MWTECTRDTNQFRDCMIRKIKGYIKTPYKGKKYFFIPNHTYDFTKIENEILYEMKQSTYVKPYPTTKAPGIPRLHVLLSCIRNMTYDATCHVPIEMKPRFKSQTQLPLFNQYTNITLRLWSIIGFVLISIQRIPLKIKYLCLCFVILCWLY